MAFLGFRTQISASLALLLASWVAPAHAAIYSYVDWTAADVASGTATGTITLPDDSTVSVDFEAINEDGSAGTLYGAQVMGVSNFWSPDAPYLSDEVENAPPTPDILQLSGGLNQTYRVTLSEPIKDPVMAIVSLGQPGLRCTYDFDSPFEIVSQGAGYWGGTATSLAALAGDVLEGYEGHGTIRFLGTFSEFSWTVPTPESWHGFTFAIRTTERLEPTPTEGGASAGGASHSGGDSSTNGGAVSDGGANSSDDGGADASGDGGASERPSGDGGRGQEPSGEGGLASAGGDDDGGGGDGDDERPLTRDEAGCNCSVPGGQLEAPVLAIAALLAGALLRRSRRARRHSA